MPWLFQAAVAATAALVLLGVLRLLRGEGYRRWVALLLLAPGPITWGVAYLRGQHTHPWYLVYVLPLLAALVGLGATCALRRVRPPAFAAALTALVCVAYLGGLVAWTATPRKALRERSIQPYRESVLLTRGTLDPSDAGRGNALTLSFSDPPDYYDPRVRVVETAEELLAWLERAEREGRPLYVNNGRLQKAAKATPELTALVEREDLFELTASLPGFEPWMSRKVYRYRPGALAVPGGAP